MTSPNPEHPHRWESARLCWGCYFGMWWWNCLVWHPALGGTPGLWVLEVMRGTSVGEMGVSSEVGVEAGGAGDEQLGGVGIADVR